MTKRWLAFDIILSLVLTVIFEKVGIATSNYSVITVIVSSMLYFSFFTFMIADAYYTIIKWKDFYYIYSLIRDIFLIIELILVCYLAENCITMEHFKIITLGIIIIIITKLSIIFTKLSGKNIK